MLGHITKVPQIPHMDLHNQISSVNIFEMYVIVGPSGILRDHFVFLMFSLNELHVFTTLN